MLGSIEKLDSEVHEINLGGELLSLIFHGYLYRAIFTKLAQRQPLRFRVVDLVTSPSDFWHKWTRSLVHYHQS